MPKIFASSVFLPVKAELTIVHLTDLHLTTLRNDNRDTPWTHKIIISDYKLHRPCFGKTFPLFQEALDLIDEKIKPDALVITGDMIDSADDASAISRAAQMIRQLPYPVIIAKGDHDMSEDPGKDLFDRTFGNTCGVRTVKGYHYFYLPYDSDPQMLAGLKENIDRMDTKKINFLCMHRMLRASLLMNILSKIYCPTLLSPHRETIVHILEMSGHPFIVLCGHSHTNYEKTINNVTHLCTASLAEYPHELRVIKIARGNMFTKVFSLEELKDYEKYLK